MSWIDIGGGARLPERLDEPTTPPRSAELIRQDIAAAGGGILGGGEPTLRADLPALLAAGADGIRTDGLPLRSPAVIASLQRAGLSRVWIRLHSARADAHDWLTGQPGSGRQVQRAIRACVRAGLWVGVEVVITRPTAAHLAQTTALAAGLGARAVALRRLTARGAAGEDFIALAPRMGLLAGELEAAAEVARASGIRLTISGIPQCLAPGCAALIQGDSTPAARCTGCPGAGQCPGLQSDYGERFGLTELWQVEPRPAPAQLRMVITPEQSTRSLRQRMVHLSTLRPQRLRLVDVATHPQAEALLREALRLSIPEVEACGDLAPLTALSHTARFRLRSIDFRCTLPVPPALDLSATPYAVISTPQQAREAPPDVALRLAPSGGRLADLAALNLPNLAPLLPPCLQPRGPEVAPFQAPDELAFPSTGIDRAGSPRDRIGAMCPCPLASACPSAPRCPGLAEGWDSAGITPG